MAIPTITLARSPGIPAGFALIQEKEEGEEVWYLRRDMDDRRARIIWKDGVEYYTPQKLSALMAKDADFDNPLLKSML